MYRDPTVALEENLFNGYQVEKLLVSRQFSNLFLALDRKDEKVFILALKKLDHTERSDGLSDLAVRFQERLRALSQPFNRNIAKVKQFGQSTDGLPFVVLEYIQGLTLAEKIIDWQNSGIPPLTIDVLEIAKSLAKTLSAAWVRGLVHTDLQPESIIINENNVPVLFDLGDPYIPELIQDSEPEAVLDYLSPEQQTGQKISKSSNMYSLGVILYEMLAGSQPQLSQFDWDIFDRKTTSREVPLREIRQDLKPETYELVSTCISRQEWSRYDSYDELDQAITAAINAEEARKAENGRVIPIPRMLLVGVPLIISLVILVIFLVSKASTTEIDQLSVPETAVFVTSTPTVVSPLQTNIFDANVKPSPTQTPTEIILVAPSPGQEYLMTDNILFEWHWPLTLSSNQHFILYRVSRNGEQEIGIIDDGDRGSQYQFSLNLAEKEWRSGEYEWFINLVDDENGEILFTSERQFFYLKPAIETVTPSMTPSTLPDDGLPIPTQVVACSPSPPPNWVSYNVQASDYLFNLAIETGTTVERIQEVNCLETVTLSIGMRLWLPILPRTATPTPTSTPDIATPEGTQPQPTPNNGAASSVPPVPEPSRTPPPLPTPTSPP